MKKKIVISLIVLILAALPGVFAQNTQNLNIGTIVSGNLNSGQEIWYSVRTTDAGILTVETRGKTDTYLEVYNSRRELIAENDDTDGLNAMIELIAAANTTYLYKLRGVSTDVTGSFLIYAAHRPTPHFTELRAGSSHGGNISGGEEIWFRIITPQNGILVIETMGEADTYLETYSDSLVPVKSDDDSGDGFNARIEMSVKAGGVYLVKLRSLWGSSTAYSITTGLLNPTPLNIGTSVTGYINERTEIWYSIRTTRSGLLVVETAGSTDTYINAYNDAYILLDSNDDGGEEGNARVEIRAEANKTYIINLRGFSTSTTGPYRIFARLDQ